MIPALARLRRSLRRPAFTAVVPLGLSCRITYQVRRVFGGGASFPFDWWLVPLPGLVRYLADPRPERLFAETALREVHEGERLFAIEHRDFGFQPFHELPREPGPTGASVRIDWRDHLGALRARHEGRLARLLALDRTGERILFVRHRHTADRSELPAQATVDALWQMLARRFPAADVRLLLLGLPGIEPPDERVTIAPLDDRPAPAPEEWRGADQAWDEAFRVLGRLPRPAERRVERAGWLSPSP